MTKFLFCCLLFFLLNGSISAVAGNDQNDTSLKVNRDSTTIIAQESAMGDDVSYDDSLFVPVPDSLLVSQGNSREVPEKQLNRFRNSPEYTYANDSTYWRKDPRQEPNLIFRILFSTVLRWVIFSFIAVLILFGIYQLIMENNFTMLIKSQKQKTNFSEQNSTGEKIDFDKIILLNQAEGNYRMAIRFLYLRLVHDMQEKSGLSFRESSTNSEITRAMGSHPESANFRWLATVYEYVYYGEFVPNLETYLVIRSRFEVLQKIFSS